MSALAGHAQPLGLHTICQANVPLLNPGQDPIKDLGINPAYPPGVDPIMPSWGKVNRLRENSLRDVLVDGGACKPCGVDL